MAGGDTVAGDKQGFFDSRATISATRGALTKRLGRSIKTQRLRRSLTEDLDIASTHLLSQTDTTGREVVSIYGFDTISDLQCSQSQPQAPGVRAAVLAQASLESDTVALKLFCSATVGRSKATPSL